MLPLGHLADGRAHPPNNRTLVVRGEMVVTE
jgi:hypothetical protein